MRRRRVERRSTRARRSRRANITQSTTSTPLVCTSPVVAEQHRRDPALASSGIPVGSSDSAANSFINCYVAAATRLAGRRCGGGPRQAARRPYRPPAGSHDARESRAACKISAPPAHRNSAPPSIILSGLRPRPPTGAGFGSVAPYPARRQRQRSAARTAEQQASKPTIVTPPRSDPCSERRELASINAHHWR